MKNPNAVSLGSLGGKASAKALTKEQRVARAKKAVQARIMKAMAKVVIWQCKTCDRFIDEKEYQAGEGSCFKCWDK